VSRNQFAVLVTILVLLTLVYVITAHGQTSAQPLTLANVCTGVRFQQKGDDLLIWCPSSAVTPWVTYKGCRRATVLRDGAGNYKVRCLDGPDVQHQ
jgi:hypothetical protein